MRTHVRNQRIDTPIEPQCAVCRGPGLVVSSYKYAGHQAAEGAPTSADAMSELDALRDDVQTLSRVLVQVERWQQQHDTPSMRSVSECRSDQPMMSTTSSELVANEIYNMENC